MKKKKIALIAGTGDLPRLIIEEGKQQGLSISIICFKENLNPDLLQISDACFSMGELGKLFKFLKDKDYQYFSFAGIIREPVYTSLRFDMIGFFHLFGVLSASLKGDDALLRHAIKSFEKQGFTYIEQKKLAQRLLSTSGALGQESMKEKDRINIKLALEAALENGFKDIGQAAIARENRVIAIEDSRGTDVMLERLINKKPFQKGLERSGVLVKILKPNQDTRVDLPTIGPGTVEKAGLAGLAGIVVESENAFILHKDIVREMADKKGMYIVGIKRQDFETENI